MKFRLDEKITSKILQILFMTGEISNDLHLAMDESYFVFRKRIRHMMSGNEVLSHDEEWHGRRFEECAILKQRGRGSDKVYAATQEALNRGLADEYDMYEYFNLYARLHYECPNRYRMRSQYMSKILMAMTQSGICVFPNEKYVPKLKSQVVPDFIVKPEDSTFYTMAEVRAEIDETNEVDEMKNISYGQSYGVYITAAENYSVYYLKPGKIYWKKTPEERTKTLYEDLIMRHRIRGKNFLVNGGIYFADKIDRFIELLDTEATKTAYFGEVYTTDIYIPIEHSRELLHLLSLPGYREIERKLLFGNNQKYELLEDDKFDAEIVRRSGDQIIERKGFIMSGILPDLTRLLYLKGFTKSYPKVDCSIVCTSWQREVYEKYFEGKVKTILINYNQFVQIAEAKSAERKKECLNGLSA